MFSIPIRVYWEDTDAGGVVYHARYVAFLERARSDFLRAMGEVDCRGMLAAARGQVPEHVVNTEVLDRPGFQAKLARWRPGG